jgi:5-methylcytosine-specific restriction endonuclease McrA
MPVRITAEDRRTAKAILRRDGYRCQRCGRYYPDGGRGLQVAHLFSRRIQATRHDPDNLAALCTGCHMYFHAHPLEAHAWWRRHLGTDRYVLLARRAKARVKL